MKPFQAKSLTEALHALFDENVSIASRQYVAGGDSNEAYRLDLTNGASLFMKKNSLGNYPFFEAEGQGIDAIRQTGCIKTPSVLAVGTDQGKQSPPFSFLLMDYLPGNQTGKNKDFWDRFAHELAAMHKADPGMTEGPFGFPTDNFIGMGKQINTPTKSWVSFFRDCRLGVQFDLAKSYFHGKDIQRIHRLLDHLDRYLPEPQYPSLLHGDLWGGNFMTGPDGYAWLIDPAVYVGHREADLAMTELFGGFSRDFYTSYKKAADIPPDYADRRDLYNLYHLLNHLNLFGGSYLHSVENILRFYAG